MASPAPLVELGRALFFDKILSGNQDIACATCHSPIYHTTDLLGLSIGTGGTRFGPVRQLGTGGFAARNAPELFDRGHPEWQALFWDGRVARTALGLETPAGSALPDGLSGLLAAQTLFPMLARVEMRGQTGENPLADLPDADPLPIWQAITGRIQAFPGYDTLMRAAYPGRTVASLTIVDIGNAIAAFVRTSWRTGGTPFDRFLAGEDAALSVEARRGGILFFGRARCGECHGGTLLTDQAFHNIGIPPLGPGIEGAIDDGRARVTGLPGDRFAVRTPPLRNVVHSSPYMHNGAYRTLEGAVRHYVNVRASLAGFPAATIDARLQPTLDLSPATLAAIEATLDPKVQAPLGLSDLDVSDLMAFLRALTDPASNILLRDIPATVPSGLPVSDY